ncbi:MAG TPA: glycosyltransferase, partial [Polyangia bacterium]
MARRALQDWGRRCRRGEAAPPGCLDSLASLALAYGSPQNLDRDPLRFFVDTTGWVWSAFGVVRGKRIAVVVPAFNEADKIARTIRSVPGFVDHVLVVDDGSRDGTARQAIRSARR